MDEQIREIFYSEDYESFYSMLNVRQQEKYDYVEHIIKTQRIVNSKFIKKIEGSEFYEARISVGSDEYRTIVFAINASNFVDCSQVLFLNSFLKKDKKQYKKEVRKAEKLIEKYLEDWYMKKLDAEKLAQLHTSSEHFNEKYGPIDSPERKAFEARANAYYYAELLKTQRKMQKLTQQQLAEMIGKKREYISQIERGNSDMQLSTFLQIAHALGLKFAMVVG